MSRKQIVILGLIAAVALLFALTFNQRSQATSDTVELHGSTTATQHPSGNKKPGFTETNVPSPRTQSTATSTAPYSTVFLQIIDPDGTSNFEVNLNPGDDLCANLVEAKAEGKIKALLIDDSYLATFGSRYVREINGYSNNWTVEVNGVVPKGCSLYKPKAGDQIIWRFSI
ncbi:MAG TPA: DUF4430 domain-containing protein [Candidatus Paceibacterota bacterium]